MDKVLKIAVILSVLIIAFSIAYYFIIFIPKKESYIQGQEKKQEDAKKYCNQWALDKAKDNNLRNDGTNEFYQQEDYDTYFKRCLNEQGA